MAREINQRHRDPSRLVVRRDLDVPTGADFVINELAQLRVLGLGDRYKDVSSGCPKLRDQIGVKSDDIYSPRSVHRASSTTARGAADALESDTVGSNAPRPHRVSCVHSAQRSRSESRAPLC